MGIPAAALGCSGPIEPEKAPERIVTTETEGGSPIVSPVSGSTVGCLVERRDSSGGASSIVRSQVDAGGRVERVTTAWNSFDRWRVREDEEHHYDESGRIVSVRDSIGARDLWTFHYDAGELTVGGARGAFILHLDDRGRIVEQISRTAVRDVVVENITWLDDVRPLTYRRAGYLQTWRWDDDGFLLESARAQTTSASEQRCTRRLSWSTTDRFVTYSARDAYGVLRVAQSFSFDDRGRLTTASLTGLDVEPFATTWVYEGDASVQALPDGETIRSSAGCHYPPTRSELASAIAASHWKPPAEVRPTFVHSLPDTFGLPTLGCSVYE